MELEAVLLADLQCHLAGDVEVMGLLGGRLEGDLLRVIATVPCRAANSSVHCDMCPGLWILQLNFDPFDGKLKLSFK
jgi:hypothetical protein